MSLEGASSRGGRLRLQIRLCFSDPAYERRFAHFYTEFYYRYARWSVMLGVLLLVGDFAMDLLFYPQVTANWGRVVLGVPLLLLSYYLSALPQIRPYWEWLMSAMIILVGLLIFELLRQIGAAGGMGIYSWVGILNFTILQLYCFVILGIRFSYALASSGVILFGFGVMVMGTLEPVLGDVISPLYLSYHIITVTVVAAGLGWWREYLLRSDFMARTDLEVAQDLTDESWQAFEQVALKNQKSLSLMEATLEATDNGILVVDRQGVITSANRRFTEMWRIPEALLASHDDQRVLQHVLDQLQDPDQFIAKVQELYATPEASSRDTLHFRDGRIFARFSHPHSLGREVVGRVWSFLDVSEEQHAKQQVVELSEALTAELERSEQQREQLQTLLEAIPDLVWMKDSKGVFLSCNPAFEKLMGAKTAAILGRTDYEFFPAEVVEKFHADDAAAVMQSTPVVRQEWVTFASDGHRALLETVKSAVWGRDHRLIGVLGIARDITQNHLLLEKLERATHEAQRSNEAKSMFLASMSHELRTPLNAIIGFTQILGMEAGAPLTAAQREAVTHILSSSHHLLGLINEVLDLARIESGQIELAVTAVALDPILDAALTMSQPLADRRQITLRRGGGRDAVIVADPNRVRQIVLNLLSNAVKYNREAGQVVVSYQQQQERLRLSVIDTGWGIPAEKQEQLFQPFQRLGAERTPIEGSGIGLLICRRLAEAMGGTISFESEVGIGSCFWLDLAVGGQPESLPSPVPIEPTEAAVAFDQLQGRVLYVEDNLVNLAVMRRIFHQLPQVELLTAESAEAGLLLVKSHRPDLVLMDINLPGMSGLEALRLLKQDPQSGSIAVIAVSAAALPQDVQQGLEAGFLSYLTKPFDVAQLLQQIRAILQSRSRQGRETARF